MRSIKVSFVLLSIPLIQMKYVWFVCWLKKLKIKETTFRKVSLANNLKRDVKFPTLTRKPACRQSFLHLVGLKILLKNPPNFVAVYCSSETHHICSMDNPLSNILVEQFSNLGKVTCRVNTCFWLATAWVFSNCL